MFGYSALGAAGVTNEPSLLGRVFRFSDDGRRDDVSTSGVWLFVDGSVAVLLRFRAIVDVLISSDSNGGEEREDVDSEPCNGESKLDEPRMLGAEVLLATPETEGPLVCTHLCGSGADCLEIVVCKSFLGGSTEVSSAVWECPDGKERPTALVRLFL